MSILNKRKCTLFWWNLLDSRSVRGGHCRNELSSYGLVRGVYRCIYRKVMWQRNEGETPDRPNKERLVNVPRLLQSGWPTYIRVEMAWAGRAEWIIQQLEHVRSVGNNLNGVDQSLAQWILRALLLVWRTYAVVAQVIGEGTLLPDHYRPMYSHGIPCML